MYCLKQGCKKSKHSNIKPPEPKKKPGNNPADILVSIYLD